VVGVNEVKDRAEQVEVVAGDPPVKVVAAAPLKYPCVKLEVILPVVIGAVVAVVNARVKIPVVVASGTRSAATEAAAEPRTLALPTEVIARTEPELAVPIITPVLGKVSVAVVVVATL
jgi:hypothetical protein